jgi:hypothetical protein
MGSASFISQRIEPNRLFASCVDESSQIVYPVHDSWCCDESSMLQQLSLKCFSNNIDASVWSSTLLQRRWQMPCACLAPQTALVGRKPIIKGKKWVRDSAKVIHAESIPFFFDSRGTWEKMREEAAAKLSRATHWNLAVGSIILDWQDLKMGIDRWQNKPVAPWGLHLLYPTVEHWAGTYA